MDGLTKMEIIGWDKVKVADEDIENATRLSYILFPSLKGMKVGPFLIQCVYEAQDVKSCERVFGQHKMDIPWNVILCTWLLYIQYFEFILARYTKGGT